MEYDGSVVIGGQIAISPDSCGPDDVGREVRKANCRLIAAAPDLLQAAEKALEYLVSEPVVAAGLDAFDVGSQLRRAIRLARGGAA